MKAPQQIERLVKRILRNEARRGETTKADVVAIGMREIARHGGPGRYGIGLAYVQMTCKRAIEDAVSRQFKVGLPENVFRVALRNAPPDLVQTLRRLPAWIAVQEGPGARWVPALRASRDDWMANYALKERIGQRTVRAANLPYDVANYLQLHDLGSLSDAFPASDDEEEEDDE